MEGLKEGWIERKGMYGLIYIEVLVLKFEPGTYSLYVRSLTTVPF